MGLIKREAIWIKKNKINNLIKDILINNKKTKLTKNNKNSKLINKANKLLI
jgi:hypothetical protein